MSSDDTREHRAFAAELKFLVTPGQAEAIRQWARARLLPDPYGHGPDNDRYSTTSLYFDTRNQDVFFRRGSHGRAKYRIRRYASSDMVFLERKLRTKELLSKRRSLVPLSDLALVPSAHKGASRWDGSWFSQRLQARKLAPVCQVSYDRTARLSPTPYGPARLTLDEQVFAQASSRIVFQDSTTTPVATGQVILELKFRVEMPAVFLALVEEFALTPGRISKYRLSMTALGLATATDSPMEIPCPVL